MRGKTSVGLLSSIPPGKLPGYAKVTQVDFRSAALATQNKHRKRPQAFDFAWSNEQNMNVGAFVSSL